MDDRYTNFYVEYDIQDVTAAGNASFVNPADQQSFTHIQSLVNKESVDLEFPRFTFEHNFNVLDGTLQPLEVEGSVPITLPFMNKTLSDASGNYVTSPSIEINFSRTHSSFAFEFYFIEDFPTELRMSFWDAEGYLLDRFTTTVDALRFVTYHDVYEYKRILIEFTKTIPKRYVKLKYIKFGTTITWDETNVQNANVVQQTDLMSKNLAIDTLSFTVVDVAGKLNLGNASGMHRYFQRDQILYPYEIIEQKNKQGEWVKTKINLGKYYLKTFSEDTNLGKMTCQSYLGLMDDITFYGGAIYNGTKAGIVIDKIFQTMGFENYVIDSETYNQLLYGTITPKSCRNALTEVLFATHSIIDSHNLEHVEIKKTTKIKRPDLLKANKFSTSTKKNDYIYGVDVKYTQYTREAETKEIAKGRYTKGTHTVYFTSPCSNLTINTGTINSQSTYSITFTLSSKSDVIITGYGYTTTTSIAQATQDNIESGQVEKTQAFSTTLLNSTQAKELAEKLLKYLSYDLTISVKFLADDNIMSDFHIVENSVDQFSNYYGQFTKRSLDLTGGFIDTATLVGTTILEPLVPFARQSNYELHAGGTALI